MPEIESLALEFTRTDRAGGGQRRFAIVPDFFPSSPSPTRRGVFTTSEVTSTLAVIREFWEKLLDLDFPTFGVDDGARRKYVAIFDASFGSGARANDQQIEIGLGALRGAQAAPTPDDRARLQAEHRATIVHELFHGVTYAVQDPFESLATFTEGSAEVAKFLLLTQEERRVSGLASFAEYLASPDRTMWDRPSPGIEGEESRSSATLFWLYFTDQLGTRAEDPGPKMDSLRHMHRSEGWREDTHITPAGIDHYIAGSFIGNGESQLVARLKAPNTRFALISPSESYGGSGQVHWARSRRSWFGDTWRIRSLDTCVAAGDIVGNGRDQIVIRSTGPMHVGVIGFNQTDGEWRTTRSEGYATAREGGRWGGWKLRERDQIHGVGNFTEESRQHILITSKRDSTANAHIGVIGLNDAGEKTTVAALPEGSTFGTGAWQYSETDVVAGFGPIVGNGRDQVVLQPAERDAIAVVGLDRDGRVETYAIVGRDERFGNGWRINPGDRVVAVAQLGDPSQASIVIQSRSGNLGVVQVDEDGSTSTGPVVAIGQSFGDDGWVWSETDEVLGVGRFPPGPTVGLVIGRSAASLPVLDELAIVLVDQSGGFATLDSTPGKRDALDRVWAIGDFASRGDDQLLGPRGSHLVAMSLEEPSYDDIGLWRESRFALPMTDRFSSTLLLLEQHMSEMGDIRSFLELWRDFTITNVTKDLTHTVPELRYSIDLEADPSNPTLVQTAPFPASVTSIDLNKWAASYLELANRAQGVWQLTARVTNGPFEAFWSVVVADSNGRLKGVHKRRGTTMDALVTLMQGDIATLIVTTTFANLSFEIDPPALVPPGQPDLPVS